MVEALPTRSPVLFAAPSAGQRVGRGSFVLRPTPALDGLRGVAVGGVLLYHADALRGGYLGVDLFFVLSGFLITSLLLRDAEEHGRIPLGEFWARRARRLLPALAGLLAGVTVYALLWAPAGDGPRLRGDALATVAYVANWHALASGAGYWDAFRAPSPFRHTWSLAIEEQFYLVWPLVVAGLVAPARAVGRRPAAAVAAVALGGAAASYAWMAALVVPGEDPSRPYFGTDTRVGAILVGAALAAVLAVRGLQASTRVVGGSSRPAGSHEPDGVAVSWRASKSRVRLEVAAAVAAAFLAVAWVTVDGRSPLLYRGGFVLAGVSVAVLIVAAVHPRRGPLARVLAAAPLRGLGLISYGLYLWHWPVYVVIQAERLRLGIDGVALVAVKVAVSIALALVSYVLVERRIRYRGLRAWGRRGRPLIPLAGVASVVAVVAVTVSSERLRTAPEVAVTAALTPAQVAALDTSIPLVRSDLSPPTTVERAGAPRTGPIPAPPGRRPRAIVVGDSVGWDVGFALADPALGIDTVNLALPACLPPRAAHQARHDGAVVVPEPPVCRWEQRWRHAVDRFRPDVAVVVFAGPPPEELFVGSQWHPLCSDEVARLWRREVDAAVRTLSAHGATVYLGVPAPHRSVYFEEDENERLGCLARVYREVAEANAGAARLVPFDEWLCPRGRCAEEVEGVEVRHDGVHFIDEGREVMGRWVSSQLFEPAPGGGVARGVLPG